MKGIVWTFKDRSSIRKQSVSNSIYLVLSIICFLFLSYLIIISTSFFEICIFIPANFLILIVIFRINKELKLRKNDVATTELFLFLGKKWSILGDEIKNKLHEAKIQYRQVEAENLSFPFKFILIINDQKCEIKIRYDMFNGYSYIQMGPVTPENLHFINRMKENIISILSEKDLL